MRRFPTLGFLRQRRIFVSHASADDEIASKLIDAMRRHGFKPYSDHDPKAANTPGEDWLNRMREELIRSNAVVILQSPAWISSSWCQAEYQMALLLKKPILPIDVDHTSSAIATHLQHLRLSSDISSDEATLIRSLNALSPLNHRLTTMPLCGSIALLAAVLAFATERASHRDWRPLPASGGAIKTLTRDGDQIVFAGAVAWNDYKGGLFESDNCGETWSKSSLPEQVTDVNDIAITKRAILIATNNGLWGRKLPFGVWQLWVKESEGDDQLVVKESPLQSDLIITGSNSPGGGGVTTATALATGDKKTLLPVGTWDMGRLHVYEPELELWHTFPAENLNDVAFSPTDSRIVYAVSVESGLLMSTDTARSFNKVAFPGRSPLRAVFSNDGKFLYVGTTDGLWIYHSEENEWIFADITKDKQVADIDMIGEEGGVTIATARGIYEADPGTADFQPASSQPGVIHINSLASCQQYQLAATGGGGIFRRRNGQINWSQSARGLDAAPAYAAYSSGSLVLVSTPTDILVSENGSRSFYPADAKLGSSATTLAVVPGRVARSRIGLVGPNVSHSVDPVGQYLAARVVAGTSLGEIAVKSQGTTSWKTTFPSRGNTDDIILSIAYVPEPKPLYFATRGTAPALRSDNFGDSWQPIGDGNLAAAYAAFALGGSKIAFALREEGGKTGFHSGERATSRVVSLDLTTGATETLLERADALVTDMTVAMSDGTAMAIDIGGQIWARSANAASFGRTGRLPSGSPLG